MTTKYCTVLAAALVASLVIVPRIGQAQTLTGAGSTFVYPIMARWAADFHRLHPGMAINYQSIGSGAGIQQVRNATVDFGASDAALTDAQMHDMPPVVQVAETAGPVCITYNLPIARTLRLTPDALAGIFLGTVTKWNDPRIVSANPGVSLPNRPVLVAHRSDGSGTTSIFTSYLASISPEWKDKVGAGVSVNWPVGLGGKGSEGVTGLVKQTQGAIGYVELTYATQNRLPVASVQNRAGQYVAPSAQGTSAAISAFASQLAKDVRVPIVNAPGAQSYPIAGLTFLILPRKGSDQAKQAALKQFVEYVLSKGQASATALGYAPLPASIANLERKLVATLP